MQKATLSIQLEHGVNGELRAFAKAESRSLANSINHILKNHLERWRADEALDRPPLKIERPAVIRR